VRRAGRSTAEPGADAGPAAARSADAGPAAARSADALIQERVNSAMAKLHEAARNPEV
jgi:hypothetical protein